MTLLHLLMCALLSLLSMTQFLALANVKESAASLA